VLNTAVADSLAALADDLEKLKPNDMAGLTKILSGMVKKHKKVLSRATTTPRSGSGGREAGAAESAQHHRVAARSRVGQGPQALLPVRRAVRARARGARRSRLGAYVKVQNIEASATLDIAKTMILPAVATYLSRVSIASSASKVSPLSRATLRPSPIEWSTRSTLSNTPSTRPRGGHCPCEAAAFREGVIPAQDAVREAADELESLVADELWPLPKYRELLFQY